jgi:hypothetical protein
MWMSEIGWSFPPHKYADVKLRPPRVAWPVTPSVGSRCAWRGAAAGDDAVFEFDEGRTQILPAVGMIRDNDEELPALSASWCRMNCTARRSDRRLGSRCGRWGGHYELLKPPICKGIAIELTPPTLKVRQTIVTA